MKRLKLDTEDDANKKVEEEIGSNIDENKKYEEKIKLASEQTFGVINNFGVSWFKVLEPEISKPYFLKVYFFKI